MAVIDSVKQEAAVQAKGQAMGATAHVSGAMMEMLATVYAYILMSAIREAIQNACDAARRAGLSISEGVEVLLPTAENPMLTVVDKGTGMTQAFMEDPAEGYLSFGSSTKRGDDGSAGGLGVGRWAAYGYIRECYIATCHACDMVQRTYFQFQGPDSKPQVQLASEVPGVAVGTKVFFPVKESDIGEALRAVAWLKSIMELTMGDSFSVNAPGRLPQLLPQASGTVLDLGSVDAGLKGVKVYPMQREALKYGRQGLQKGSLVVLTNQAAGVGGLPFHVQALTEESVFNSGMVIEIPMSFRVPFMPSREEVKYTDEVHSLMRSIDAAARVAVVKQVAALYEHRSLSSKAELSRLLGDKTSDSWHCFARASRTDMTLSSELRAACGGRNWFGELDVPYLDELRDRDLTCKHYGTFASLKTVQCSSDVMAVSDSAGKPLVPIRIGTNRCVVVVNDLKSGGLARFREMVDDYANGTRFIFFGHNKDWTKAQAAGRALNDAFGGELELVRTSSLPDCKRTVVGSRLVRTKVGGGGTLVYYCTAESKQKTAADGLADGGHRRRIWVGKNGAEVSGIKSELMLSNLFDGYSSGLANVLEAAKVTRLYLLNQKQEDELMNLVDTLKEDGHWELSEAELLEEHDGDVLAETVGAAKSWMHLEDVVQEVLASPRVQSVAHGHVMQSVTENTYLNQLVTALARKPRMELTGSKFDKAMAPYVDLLSCEVKLHRQKGVHQPDYQLCQALVRFGGAMLVASDDAVRAALSADLLALRTAGVVNYNDIYQDLVKRFPLLGMFKNTAISDIEADATSQAIAALYR